MNPQQLKNIIEAALLAADQPLSVDRLLNLFLDAEQPSRDEIRAALAELTQDYEGRGIEVKEVSSGFRIQVCSDVASWVSRLWEERPARYSRALLETLVLIAYKQPVTRGDIEDVRGVAVSSQIIKTLLEREWVRVLGHREVPGRPALYGTTKVFLDYFNLKSLEDLPTLSEIKDLDDLNASLNFEEVVSGSNVDAENAESAADSTEEETVTPDEEQGEQIIIATDSDNNEAIAEESSSAQKTDEENTAQEIQTQPQQDQPPSGLTANG